MRLLLFNLATDADDPLLGFTTFWIRAIARRVTSIHVITMRSGRCDLPDNVTLYSVGKEKGYSEPRRVLEFFRHLFSILGHRHYLLSLTGWMRKRGLRPKRGNKQKL